VEFGEEDSRVDPEVELWVVGSTVVGMGDEEGDSEVEEKEVRVTTWEVEVGVTTGDEVAESTVDEFPFPPI